MSRKPSLLATAIKTAESPATEPAAPALFDTPTEPKRPARGQQSGGTSVPPPRANKSAKPHAPPPAYSETLEGLCF